MEMRSVGSGRMQNVERVHQDTKERQQGVLDPESDFSQTSLHRASR